MSAPSLKIAETQKVQESLGTKLKTARSLTGLSTRAVAELLQPRFPISHATIANYEKCSSVPPIDVLGALATVYDRPLNWFLEKSTGLTGVKYRNLKSRTKSSELLSYEAETQRWLDAYVAAEKKLKRPLKAQFEMPCSEPDKDINELALDIRRRIGISFDEPIPSVVQVLEGFGIRVVEVVSSVPIDGLAAKYGDELVVALNPNVPNERSRMNAAHELAHILFGDCGDGTGESKELEQRAFQFASMFLLPNRQLKAAFEGLSMVRLVQYKERFGISLAAMVYRAEQLNLIKKSLAKSLWIEFSKRGWRTKEPGTVSPDRATRLEQILEELIRSGAMSLKEVADLCGVRTNDIRDRLNLAIGMNIASREDEVGVLAFPTEYGHS